MKPFTTVRQAIAWSKRNAHGPFCFHVLGSVGQTSSRRREFILDSYLLDYTLRTLCTALKTTVIGNH